MVLVGNAHPTKFFPAPKFIYGVLPSPLSSSLLPPNSQQL